VHARPPLLRAFPTARSSDLNRAFAPAAFLPDQRLDQRRAEIEPLGEFVDFGGVGTWDEAGGEVCAAGGAFDAGHDVRRHVRRRRSAGPTAALEARENLACRL